MDIRFEKKFKENREQILKEISVRYGTCSKYIKFVGGFDSFVYEANINQIPCIIKIMDTIRRTTEMVTGEIEFINFLYDNGISVSRSIQSLSGNYIEKLNIEGYLFLAVAYEKAPGNLPTEKDWDAELFMTWGSIMGKMHKLSKSFSPSQAKFKRSEWYEMDFFQFEKHIPETDLLVLESARKLIDKLESFGKERDAYGLIHGDFHHLNYFVDNGKMKVFDFDDSHYNWFVYDIACVLYYVNRRILKNYDNYTEFFYQNFIKGYNKYNTLDDKWLDEIPTFVRLRHMISYIILNQVIDVNNMDDELSLFYNKIKTEVEQDKDLIDFKFLHSN